ncbi:MAG: 23S rRNA (adenine(1618)-N(6))-methyltransferase RlmF [Daejeonella sp.]
MSKAIKAKSGEKINLHPRNKHRFQYDFKHLIKCNPELEKFVFVNEFGTETIRFADPQAVKSLNRALLFCFYDIHFWDFPAGFLCPPIPGRADYIHYAADLLANTKPLRQIKVLEIGTGANCIYPLIGNKEYQWKFVGSEINPDAIKSARNIISKNNLGGEIEIRQQVNSRQIFKGVITEDDYFDLSICNPPFHSSKQEAHNAAQNKIRKLGNSASSNLNFGGKEAELFCDGGEEEFLKNMILESADFADQIGWFTSLVSKKTSLKSANYWLGKVKAEKIKTIEMSQGQKVSRILAWTFRKDLPENE